MRIRKKYFTLFEMLISIGLLVILSVVLLRTFALTSDYWTTTKSQSQFFTDGKIALSLISDDLENMIYQGSSLALADGWTASAGDIVAPLWLQGIALGANTINCYESYKDGTTKYSAALHMITRTKLRDTGSSDICQVSYYFVPPSQNGSDWSDYYSGDGTLVRACVADNQAKFSFGTKNKVDELYNIDNTTTDHVYLKKVLTGVLDFRVYAYKKVTIDELNDSSKTIAPADLITKSGSEIEIKNGDIKPTHDLNGARDIETIHIAITLIAPDKLPELRNLSGDDAKDFIKKHARTFHKTVRIRKLSED